MSVTLSYITASYLLLATRSHRLGTLPRSNSTQQEEMHREFLSMLQVLHVKTGTARWLNKSHCVCYMGLLGFITSLGKGLQRKSEGSGKDYFSSSFSRNRECQNF